MNREELIKEFYKTHHKGDTYFEYAIVGNINWTFWYDSTGDTSERNFDKNNNLIFMYPNLNYLRSRRVNKLGFMNIICK